MAQNPLGTKQWTPIPEMTKSEMEEELEGWRVVASYITDEVTYYLRNVGQECRVLTRTNRAYFGTLGVPHFTIADIEVNVEEVEHDYQAGRRFREQKLVRIPIGSVSLFQIIYDRFEEENEEIDRDKEILGLVRVGDAVEEGSNNNGTDA